MGFAFLANLLKMLKLEINYTKISSKTLCNNQKPYLVII
ncbi:hypothetical protein JCM19301_3019 [Jejuia pallidilutea]|uniref:Uncharacterized protein n=1 Tax=Jejuia pallidilutea TaxID=504487 RepID=A0A090VPC9_9FLAO|nr:hypothetical protein JCM19301_3019 [Jejuia pallidilutea]GAL69796.1 hypothetical protein JCM19302_691 [Jejuia pallidilutea]GAL90848.1 hypothetical protein JCM19538_906 [Jejuia pallidilutea]